MILTEQGKSIFVAVYFEGRSPASYEEVGFTNEAFSEWLEDRQLELEA